MERVNRPCGMRGTGDSAKDNSCSPTPATVGRELGAVLRFGCTGGSGSGQGQGLAEGGLDVGQGLAGILF